MFLTFRWVVRGGQCDYFESLSPKIQIWDFGLIFGTLELRTWTFMRQTNGH